MTAMLRQSRPRVGRWRPRLEGLEPRRLFSVGADATLTPTTPASLIAAEASAAADPITLAVVRTDPAPGAVVSTSPATLTVTFNLPLDPFSQSTQDFQLVQVNADGSTTPLDSTVLNEPGLNNSASSLALSLNQPLGTGHYQLVLLGSSILANADDTVFLPPPPADPLGWTVADFTIAPAGVTLADATPIGTAGPKSIVVAGTLDLSRNPGAVRLDQFTVPAGHFWRVGAEVSAWRDGGTLSTTLSLFDARGTLLATSSTGRPDFPNDPYLFAGLKAGTYYLGVSGAGNVPGTPGGYNPVTGASGSSPQAQPGGAFRLRLAADPADAPTALSGVQLNWTDSLDPSPTGVTLQFTGPINVRSIQGDPTPGLVLVDQKGTTWPLTAVNYQELTSRITFLFNQRLPAGSYTLKVPAHGGITDLAGLTPVAPGAAAGVLATWKVSPRLPLQGPNDLGALYHNVHDGIKQTALIAPGTGLSQRFVATQAGFSKLGVQSDAGPITIQLIGPTGLVVLNPAPAGGFVSNRAYLMPGVYHLQLINSGTAPAQVSWLLQSETQWDSLLSNGVGQGPALNLMMLPSPPPLSATIDPATALNGPFIGPSAEVNGISAGPSTALNGPVVGPATAGGSAPALVNPGVPASASGGGNVGFPTTTPSVPAGPAGLVLTLGGTLVGSPNPQAEHVTVVGPMTPEGAPALAYGLSGLPEGIAYGRSRGFPPTATPRTPEGEGPVTDMAAAALKEEEQPAPADPDAAAPVNGALVFQTTPETTRTDARALENADRLSQIAALVSSWLQPKSRNQEAPITPEPTPEALAAALTDVKTNDERLRHRGQDHVEHADLGMTLGIGVLTVVAVRLQRSLHDRINRARALSARRRACPSTTPMPHSWFAKARSRRLRV